MLSNLLLMITDNARRFRRELLFCSGRGGRGWSVGATGLQVRRRGFAGEGLGVSGSARVGG